LAESSQFLSFQQSFRDVELQNPSSHFTNRCQRHNAAIVDCEMVGPGIHARVEESDELTAFPMDRPDIASFGAIAEDTRIREVLGTRRSPVFLTNHMIDLAAKEDV
jgi:hypothetical protein